MVNIKTFKEKLKKGVVLKMFGIKFHLRLSRVNDNTNIAKGVNLLRKQPQNSPQQDDVFTNNFQFNMYVDSNLDIEEKRRIIAQVFYKNVGYYPNINNPKTFSEKVLWLKLYHDDSRIRLGCDKANMKEYVDNVLGEGYTVPILKKYNNVFDINIDELPDKFVLKVNWATGCNIIVNDKTKININKIRSNLDRWMLPWKSSFFGTFNRGYKGMKPIVFAEQYLNIPENSTEYKVFCFNGKAKFTLIELDYFGKNPQRAYYDKDWNEVPFQFGNIKKVQLPEPPANYVKILELAEKLAEPFPYIRVDFYDIDGKLYVGELTFYSGGGFSKIQPLEYDKILGEELDISSVFDKHNRQEGV